MSLEQLLQLPPDLAITNIQATPDEVILTVQTTAASAACPLCGGSSHRVHSWYRRLVADVPCGHRRIMIHLQTRKWHCDVIACPRRIFMERFPHFALPYAHMTLRLQATIARIGCAITGRGGARFAARIGIRSSPSTIIRRTMALPDPPTAPVIEVGIDDFAFRRGQHFGAIVVDLQRHQVVDLLPDRTAATAETWLRHHPELRLVSRDRSLEFATAITHGAPQAQQVADKFHLMQNLSEAVAAVLTRCRTAIRRSISPPSMPPPTAPSPVPAPSIPVLAEWKSAPAPKAEHARLVRQEQRLARCHQMQALQAQGLSTAGIASHLGMKERTVRRWLHAFRPDSHRRKRPSPFDPFAGYVLQRWQEGCHHGTQLWQELVAQGFTGSARMVYRYLRALRQPSLPTVSPVHLATALTLG